ncbi:ABC transporter permease [Oceanobacillus halotolerans]|uniref:ABC transporter permease n=1 Tax=Oceanobacillus halotolerans TaxID=2663380 RepID=UPI0013D974AB|nr:ABC transporter permease [Oceanobacillus halotolerans]
MSRFFHLLINEHMKLYIRKSTWIMYGLLAIIIVGLGLLSNTFTNDVEYDDNWRETLQEENEQLIKENEEFQENMANGDAEIYAGPNSHLIEKNNYYLENDIQPTPYDAWQFVMENEMLLSIVSLLTIIIAAGIVAHEFKWGTIKLLLIRPITRAKILLSKYVTVLLFAFYTLCFVLIFSWIVGALFFGVAGMSPHIVINQNGDFAQVSVLSEIMSGYGYKLINLVMMATFAFMISTIFRNSTIAIGLAIFLMMAGNSIVTFFADRAWAKYILFANTDLSQYADGNSPWIDDMTLQFSISVLVVYYIIFLALSWLFFTKRDVAGQ